MVRLDHPTVKDVHVDVPAKDVKRWKRSGWVKPTTPANSSSSNGEAPTPTPAPPETAANEKE